MDENAHFPKAGAKEWSESPSAAFMMSYARFGESNDPADLDEAIGRGRAALQDAGDLHDAGTVMTGLGMALLQRVLLGVEETDLNEGIQFTERGLDRIPPEHPLWPLGVSMLVSALGQRFGASDASTDSAADLTDLDKAISLARSALPRLPSEHPERCTLLTALGIAHQSRFKHTKDRGDWRQAVSFAKQAIDLAPDDPSIQRPAYHLYSSVLIEHALITGDLENLNEGVRYARHAVGTFPQRDFSWCYSLTQFSGTLVQAAEILGAVEHLDEAVTVARQAAAASPLGDPWRSEHLKTLSLALAARSVLRTGDPAELDEAIDVGRRAVEAVGGSQDPSTVLQALMQVLFQRYKRLGNRSDLDAAIGLGQRFMSMDERTRPSFPFLAILYLERFTLIDRTVYSSGAIAERQRALDSVIDLDKARMLATEAVHKSSAHHYEHSASLSLLTNVMLARAKRFEDVRSLDDAIGHARRGIEVVAAGDERAIEHRINLAQCLMLRPTINPGISSPAELDEVVELARGLLDEIDENHRHRAQVQQILAQAAYARYERSKSPDDLKMALDAGAAVAGSPSAHLHRRIQAAASTSDRLASVDVDRAAELAAEAVALLPQIAPRRLRYEEQRDNLRGFTGMAGHAASLTLSCSRGSARERAEQAIQLLETGRGVTLAQAFDAQSDLSALRREHPDLAGRFERLRDLLDREADVEPPTAPAVRAGRRDRHALDRDFTGLIGTIRMIKGFESFASPPGAAELLSEGAHGPVVVFSTSRLRCDALVITGDEIVHVPLPRLTLDEIVERSGEFTELLQAGRHGKDRRERVEAQRKIVDLLAWLWDAATGPVLEALGIHGPPANGAPWPRVWWVPSGHLALFPLHAAGHHARSAQTGWRTVMDRVVSSYAPTVRSLRFAREKSGRGADTLPGRALAVAMPTTPGLPDGGRLRHVDAEVAAVVRALAPHITVLREPGLEAADSPALAPHLPTRENVLHHLPGHTIAHFACHGMSDYDPSQSRLLLRDHAQAPFTAGSMNPVRLDRARLAYLSACSTSTVEDALLPDESIHVTAAFQLAGFAHVIGTLWQVDDQIAVTVAERFYENLRGENGLVDPDRAPFALHDAVRYVRAGDDLAAPGLDRTAVPTLWAGFMHTGA